MNTVKLKINVEHWKTYFMVYEWFVNFKNC